MPCFVGSVEASTVSVQESQSQASVWSYNVSIKYLATKTTAGPFAMAATLSCSCQGRLVLQSRKKSYTLGNGSNNGLQAESSVR